MISAINDFERENMLERQRGGIAIAKGVGKYKGRKEVSISDFNKTISKIHESRSIKVSPCKGIRCIKSNIGQIN
jgi:DNA invertase Pin-like site-specific DNA recombinase